MNKNAQTNQKLVCHLKSIECLRVGGRYRQETDSATILGKHAGTQSDGEWVDYAYSFGNINKFAWNCNLKMMPVCLAHCSTRVSFGNEVTTLFTPTLRKANWWTDVTMTTLSHNIFWNIDSVLGYLYYIIPMILANPNNIRLLNQIISKLNRMF